jgi:hypothetical protein
VFVFPNIEMRLDRQGSKQQRYCEKYSRRRRTGPISTPLRVSGGATQEHLIHFGETYPLRRAGQPAELASIYVQLAANDGSCTTGNIYGAGGGQP